MELVEELCVAPAAAAGDALPSEGELATRFGVSRMVLREAMNTLEARGLVVRRQGKPAVIASPNALPVENFVALAVLRDRRALVEFTEIRAGLEIHGVRLAAQRLTGAERAAALVHIDAARRTCADLRADPADVANRVRADLTFHKELVAASGNSSLVQILDALERTLAASREQSHQSYLASGADPAASATEHDVLLDAVLSGDPARAATEMEHHLRVTLQEIETRP
ncbi:FadR/GntR family transcriptional regulator [Cellulomonas sp. PhB143]|uniref:FadR/GntR family transcriptional regulator n=1 Tax=Cellulomonas sp. PhB143 TaxID=2485186 RepID=UPI0018F5D450|nr:FCD domain-containing protein [Cellulomonas sp. PhB143]